VPDLLRETSGIMPVEAWTHVILEKHAVQSAQRLAIGEIGGKVIAALWPAELRPGLFRQLSPGSAHSLGRSPGPNRYLYPMGVVPKHLTA
jgi:hypothetical protein